MFNVRVTTEIPAERSGHIDTAFLISVILLWGFGTVTLFITSTNVAVRIFDDALYFVKRQMLYSIAGFALMTLFAVFPLETLRRVLPKLAFGSFMLCLMVFLPVIGVERNAARRWIRMPLFGTFQPSETAKFVVILFLANLFTKQIDSEGDVQIKLFAPVTGLGLFVAVIFLQKDFSNGAFMLAIGIVLFFVAGLRIRWFLSLCIFIVPITILFICTEPYRVNRLIAFLCPGYDIYGLNYQSNMSRLAINAGELFGKGFGSGLIRINRIPEVQSDYIFAGWTEAMGFVGVLSYFVLLFFFAWRGFRASITTTDRFGSYCAFGATASVIMQSLLNCGIVCNAFPATGIPLPFFSSGGSSLLITFIMSGIILQISRIQTKRIRKIYS